jgi:Tol biopolymer transport system component
MKARTELRTARATWKRAATCLVTLAGALALATTAFAQGKGGKPGGGGGGTPPGNPAIVYVGDGDLKVMDADGGNKRVVLKAGTGSIRNPCFFSDGQRILFVFYDGSSNGNSAGIYSVNMDGTERTLIVPHSPWETRPSVSPGPAAHGKYRIAFTERLEHGIYRLFVVNEDGSGLAQLISSERVAQVEAETSPSWSPDGRHLAYLYGAHNGGPKLYGSGLRLLALGEDEDGNIWVEEDRLLLRTDFEAPETGFQLISSPSFSKTTNTIYFTGDPWNAREVWALELNDLFDITGLVQITDDPGWDKNIVSASSVGDKIAYGAYGQVSSRRNGSVVFVANSDGSNPQPTQDLSRNNLESQEMPSFR